MEFIYVLINFLLLVALLLLVARKPVARIFSGRRERLNRELDEADRAMSEQAELPQVPPRGPGELRSWRGLPRPDRPRPGALRPVTRPGVPSCGASWSPRRARS